MVLTDPFDYAAEDALMDAWLAAAPSVAVPEFANPPGFGLAYSGPDGRPRLHAEFDRVSGPAVRWRASASSTCRSR